MGYCRYLQVCQVTGRAHHALKNTYWISTMEKLRHPTNTEHKEISMHRMDSASGAGHVLKHVALCVGRDMVKVVITFPKKFPCFFFSLSLSFYSNKKKPLCYTRLNLSVYYCYYMYVYQSSAVLLQWSLPLVYQSMTSVPQLEARTHTAGVGRTVLHAWLCHG